MLYQLVNDFPNELINLEKGPFISIYLPTERKKPESTQNAIKFRNLLKQVEKTLKESHKDANIEAIMKRLNQIADDNLFWNKVKEGLAILANEDECLVYRLPQTVNELAVVGDSFHIKPLIRVYQSADRYQILALNRTSFKLYEGNRYGFEEIKIDEDIPTTLDDVLGSDPTEASLYLESKPEEIKKNTEKYFRHVDRFVMDNYSKHSKLPLVLVTLSEHQGIFRDLSHNTCLIKETINIDPESLTKEQLQKQVWESLEPIYLEKTKELVEKFGNERAKFSGSDDVAEIARTATEGNVSKLLIESGRIVKGKVREDGQIEFDPNAESTHEDVLDDIAELVFRNGGEVIVLPKERMPSTTGAAAIFRY